jgi:membrane-associated phospholipid phosphatase
MHTVKVLMNTDPENTRFDVVMAVTVVPLLVLDIILTYMAHLDGLGTLKAVASVSFGSIGLWILVAAYGYCRWYGMTKLTDIAQISAWALLVIPAISFLIPVAGRSPYPLVDAELARIDAHLHFHTASVVRWVSLLPRLRFAFALTYALLPVIVLAALLIPSLVGRALDSRRYMLAVLFAAIMTATLFAFWPAAGPWTVEGFAPTHSQSEVLDSLALLKAGMPLPANTKSAVVAFPSFHVILAVLSVMALWQVRWARWVAFIFGTAVCASTITTGWHYGIDVLGGLVVTYLAHLAAKSVLRPIAVPLAAQIPYGNVEVAGTAC